MSDLVSEKLRKLADKLEHMSPETHTKLYKEAMKRTPPELLCFWHGRNDPKLGYTSGCEAKNSFGLPVRFIRGFTYCPYCGKRVIFSE
jgi:hypothetical protein